MAARTSEGYKTPVPHRDNEARGRGSGPVITYTLSPEELERYRNDGSLPIKNRDGEMKKAPQIPPSRSSEEQRRRANVRYQKEDKSMSNKPKDGEQVKLPNKIEFLKLIAAGRSINAAGKLIGLAGGQLYYWIGKWNLKGVKSKEQAQQLLDEMAIDGAVTSCEPVQDATSEPEQTETVLREKNLQDEKDIEIQRLRDELANTIGERNQLQEAAKGAAVIANQAGERIRELEQERDDYKRAAEDLEAKVLAEPAVVTLAESRAKRSMRIEVVDGQNVIEDELLAVLAYVQAMRGKNLQMELYLGEVAQ